MTPAYQAVQAGHAVAEFLLTHNNIWRNSTLIYLGVKDENDLEKWLYKIKDSPHAVFREPDIDNQMTAVAVVSDQKMFKSLRLL